MAMSRRYDTWEWQHRGSPRKPVRNKNIYYDKTIKAKNAEAVSSAAQKISDETGLDLSKIIVSYAGYSGVTLQWVLPETDESFDKRIKKWEKEKAAYQEWKEERKAEQRAAEAEIKKRELAEAAKTRRNVVDLLAEAIQTDPSLLDAAKKKVESSKRKV